MDTLRSLSGSAAEDMFIGLFADTFGMEKAGYLYSQYPFYDIYQNARYADFVLENGADRIAIEVDDDASHHPGLVSTDKHTDDLLKQNSMIHMGWDVYRWTVRQLQRTPETVKDELRLFMGSDPRFREIDDYLPSQLGSALSGEQLELREYQQAALENLRSLREQKQSIALLYQATGTGKTVTAVMDAKSMGGRVLFVAHTMELVRQAMNTFKRVWPEVSCGQFADSIKEPGAYVVCGSIQSIALNLNAFRDSEFDYLIIDEAHHASAETYRKVLSYFSPKFTLGLTATPERTDECSILDIFKSTAHKLDIQTAVEIGALVDVRCVRIHTNIDMTKVRFNGNQYNIRELEDKIRVPERNRLIVDTWIDYVRNKRTVVFCVSVEHAGRISELFRERGISAAAVSGSMKTSERREIIRKFETGEIPVLCACDLLNEGWDCPQTEVLFMARPTMSKVLYTQQLGRGMRLSEGKEYLTVFDFVDNASMYNSSWSLHKLLKIKDYHPGALVLGKKGAREAEAELYRRGEKPEAVVDYPVYATDYELVDIFNWQDEVSDMYSQQELIRHLSVNSTGTIDKYIRDGKIQPDFDLPVSGNRLYHYFKKDRVQEFADRFGWTVIEDSNKIDLFMDMIEKMRMDHSYKPVFIKCALACADSKGRITLDELAGAFRAFYDGRREIGAVVEDSDSILNDPSATDRQIEYLILSNPFKRFENMSMMHHSKSLGIIEIDGNIWKYMDEERRAGIIRICDEKIAAYYGRLDRRERDK